MELVKLVGDGEDQWIDYMWSQYFDVGTYIFVCDLVILCIMEVNNCPLYNGCAKDKTVLWLDVYCFLACSFMNADRFKIKFAFANGLILHC